MTSSPYRMAAAVAFAVASVTDFADGWIARTFNQVTTFGKVADPIADKALTGTALVLLSLYDALPWWVTVVILARELGVTALRFWVIRHGVIPASRGGKVKTVLQILAIVWYIWPFPESRSSAVPFSYLSEIGSATVPNYVTSWNRRAIQPSTKSVADATQKVRQAAIRQPSAVISDTIASTTNTGTSTIRTTVSRFAGL
jgi:CDP-diacylglycerol--glycerol-3-phosphate 3-phosphatidyltransferase